MQTLSVSKVKDRLGELVDAVQLTHEEVVITGHGSPAAVLISTDELAALRETVFWLSQPGIHEDLTQARTELAIGQGPTEQELRSRFGAPRR